MSAARRVFSTNRPLAVAIYRHHSSMYALMRGVDQCRVLTLFSALYNVNKLFCKIYANSIALSFIVA